MQWLMQNGNVITDNAGTICSLWCWRDVYAVHDMNSFTNTRARKIISPYCAFGGRSAPCVQLRRQYGSSDFPRQKTRPTYNACVMAWCRCAKAQQGDLHSMTISSNNHTTKAYMTFRLYAWQCLKWHAACLHRAPILGTYRTISRGL